MAKKTSRFKFILPGFRGINMILKQKLFFNSREGLFRKSPFCTFPCINPGFGGPWDMLWIFFLIAIFIILQKNVLGQIFFQIGFKSAILEKLKNCQNGTFEPMHEIWKKIWSRAFFWSIMKMAIRKNIPNMSQGPLNLGFMQEKVQKGDFLKKPSRELKNYFCFRIVWIPWTPGRVN